MENLEWFQTVALRAAIQCADPCSCIVPVMRLGDREIPTVPNAPSSSYAVMKMADRTMIHYLSNFLCYLVGSRRFWSRFLQHPFRRSLLMSSTKWGYIVHKVVNSQVNLPPIFTVLSFLFLRLDWLLDFFLFPRQSGSYWYMRMVAITIADKAMPPTSIRSLLVNVVDIILILVYGLVK